MLDKHNSGTLTKFTISAFSYNNGIF